MATLQPERGHGGAQKYDDFRRVLARVEEHPSHAYYVLKSIVVGNLYGVDIMEEAVEICKLRLFLKLVAQVERPAQIEPLPDIDFNVRAGNTLAGFATPDEVKVAVQSGGGAQLRLDLDDEFPDIDEKAEIADRAYRMFQSMQTEHGMKAEEFAAAKVELRRRLDDLRDRLDSYLARQYGVDVAETGGFADWQPFHQWRASHLPFHRFAKFYGIMKRGGFDVIIGNSPWKEYSAVKKDYKVRGYATESCGNLHGICTERALTLRLPGGYASFIVQLPLASSSRMAPVRNLLNQRSSSLHVMTFDDRPGKLFEGLQHCRSVIFLSRGRGDAPASCLATTRYQRWPTATRPYLFEQIEYARVAGGIIYPGQFPKYANAVEEALFRKTEERGTQRVAELLSKRATEHYIFYQEATQYWVKATVGLPYYAKDGVVGPPAHGRYLYFDRPETAHVVCAVLNSSLFYAYFIAYSDCFHLSDGLATGFPLSPGISSDAPFAALNSRLMCDLTAKAEIKTISTADGYKITYAEFYGSRSKPIIDEIDRVLARHYDFTDEELDFIINYDDNYRMGQGADEGDE